MFVKLWGGQFDFSGEVPGDVLLLDGLEEVLLPRGGGLVPQEHLHRGLGSFAALTRARS